MGRRYRTAEQTRISCASPWNSEFRHSRWLRLRLLEPFWSVELKRSAKLSFRHLNQVDKRYKKKGHTWFTHDCENFTWLCNSGDASKNNSRSVVFLFSPFSRSLNRNRNDQVFPDKNFRQLLAFFVDDGMRNAVISINVPASRFRAFGDHACTVAASGAHEELRWKWEKQR